MKFSKEEIRALKDAALAKKLKGADILNEFSEDQMVESFNGAGGEADPEWKKWILTKILKKKLPAVLVHDMKFRKGGNEDEFHKVNEELRDNISSMDDDGKSAWWNFVGRKAQEYSDSSGRPGWGKA